MPLHAGPTLLLLITLLVACFCTVQSGCPVGHAIHKHRTIFGGTNHWRRCEWTFRPRDSNHIVRFSPLYLWENQFNQRYHPKSWSSSFRPMTEPSINNAQCEYILTMRTDSELSYEQLRDAFSEVYTDSVANLSSFANSSRRKFCKWKGYRYMDRAAQSYLTVGAINVTLQASESVRQTGNLNTYFMVQQIPITQPGLSDLCPRPLMHSPKNSAHSIRALGSWRNISGKQVVLKSDRDCRTNYLTVLHERLGYETGFLVVSVNCTRGNGSLLVVFDMEDVSTVACNSVASLHATREQHLITVVGEGTGGFSATLDEMLTIEDDPGLCPWLFPGTKLDWIANLPLLFEDVMKSWETNLKGTAFYCPIKLSPPPGQDLMVQVHLSFSDKLLEQFCKLLSTGPYLQPYLSLTVSAPNSRDYEYQLCDHKMPGLLIQNRIRVVSGGSLTVDLIATQLHPQLRYQSDFIGSSLGSNEVDAVIVFHQVDSCPSPSHFNSWQLSPDRTQILNTLTVVPGNSQTNCNLHLNAASAVSIANEKQIRTPNAENPTCWNLRVMLHKFDTTCGLHQLMLTVSNWDFVAASIVHKQKEVCGNGNFTWNVTLLMQADTDTGMSLWYSGVRSGFVAQFSLTKCENSDLSVMETTDELVSNGDFDDGSFPLKMVVLLLALSNLSVVLFALRSRILNSIHIFIGGAQSFWGIL